jgi:flagellar biosynthesis protein
MLNDKTKRLRQKAVALEYNPDELAPKVVAKGAGIIADKILEYAKDADIAVYKDAKLVEELTKMDLGQHIPPELYEAVAQILVFVSNLDKEAALREARARGLEAALE